MKGKKIVLGITGSIAAYKACTLIRLFIKAGAEVQVVITPAGKEFVTPVTLSTLTSKPVVSDFFSRRDGSWHSHVDLGLWADAMVIAPCTASTLGKMAHGIADNMLITTYLSMKAPVFIAPAMDLDMYRHPATQANLRTLQQFGNHIIEAASGELASHLVGKGRMEEPEFIFKAIADYFTLQDAIAHKKDLQGRRVLITAGPTYEKLDAVRFIGNFSTGKMGFALAEECAARGAQVELVAGPVSLHTHHPSIHRTDVMSAQQMYDAATLLFNDCDTAILCAAVADFTPKHVADSKIKREGSGGLHIDLQPTHDIARQLGQMKRKEQKLVGFALETDNELDHALDKLQRKNLDFIVLNSLRTPGAGFAYDTNQVTLLFADGSRKDFDLKSKREVASDIVDFL
ncbi:MAG: bifunctional phosphopantothenoylcysteine decarboxylase/phosphopantothenate--cysteine ligase CoaBC [Prevotella sp.]|nr:bifunctional phosphopantothenoylcysteine decarboxylase/phosphopantothenate--cysteine ligase CoaBC [Prevotella sp.]MDY5667177.1 bifunctional phosphopantothenoylcysteine decarboxylase/phosphopantothenate--cysteine ligase CoaBC [Alloprevotella sp.]